MIEETKPGNRPSASKPPYAWRVLIIYGLFGPPFGVVLWMISLSLSNPNPEQAFILLPLAIVSSYLVGGIPAFLTGLLAMLLRLKRNLPGIAAVTAAGALLSVIYPSIMFGMSASSDSGLFLGCGLAAAFVLSVFLPKP